MPVIPTFVDTNPEVIEALKVTFASFYEVDLYNEKFEDVIKDFPAFVTAGNSFGIMDGGIDLAVRDYFGEEIQKEVQDKILLNFSGFMPVGTSLCVTRDYKSIIYVPTMFYPMNVSYSLNAYLAMQAALIEADKHSFETILVPGFCTLSGKMDPKVAAIQMAQAYIHYLEPPANPDWEATKAFWQGFRKPGF